MDTGRAIRIENGHWRGGWYYDTEIRGAGTKHAMGSAQGVSEDKGKDTWGDEDSPKGHTHEQLFLPSRVLPHLIPLLPHRARAELNTKSDTRRSLPRSPKSFPAVRARKSDPSLRMRKHSTDMRRKHGLRNCTHQNPVSGTPRPVCLRIKYRPHQQRRIQLSSGHVSGRRALGAQGAGWTGPVYMQVQRKRNMLGVRGKGMSVRQLGGAELRQHRTEELSRWRIARARVQRQRERSPERPLRTM
ncbi:hypothetical protein C8R44DRAFT_747741 [Mycena epipterygia]|nr:hypothetical protein C8R44DRAFT_747741 [Mycena epipterygia]